MKKFKVLPLVLSLGLTLLPANTASVLGADINILINGKPVAFTESSGQPFVDENSRTMVPLRVTMEAAGAAVGYDSSKKTAIVITEKDRIEVPVGQSFLYNNNIKIQNDTSAVIKDSRIYLPIRAVLESADFTVEWDPQTKTVNAYNFSYDSNKLVPYDAGDIVTLARDVISGNVVYINGHYYATPDYVKLLKNSKIEYYNEDINIAQYPAPSRYSLADYKIVDVKAEWVSEIDLSKNEIRLESSTYGGRNSKGFYKTGYASSLLYEMPSLPDNFTTSPYSGTFDGIQIKVDNGTMYFLQDDLIALGVVSDPIMEKVAIIE